LRAVGVARNGSARSVVVTLPDAALPVVPMLVTSGQLGPKQEVTVLACRIEKNACSEVALQGRITSVTTTEKSQEFTATVSGAQDDLLAVGAPVVTSEGIALGIVRSARRTDTGFVVDCDSLAFSTWVPRTTMSLGVPLPR